MAKTAHSRFLGANVARLRKCAKIGNVQFFAHFDSRIASR